MRKDEERLRDILDASDEVREFVAGADRETFINSKMMRAAVVQKLTTVGEAASRLSPELRDRHPGIPWKRIRGMRNIVVHDYIGIDYEIIWESASAELPILAKQLTEILASDFGG